MPNRQRPDNSDVKIQMLGVPLGSAEFTDEFVKNDLCSATEGVMSKLVEFEDTQAALYLLRLSSAFVVQLTSRLVSLVQPSQQVQDTSWPL